MLVEGVSVLVHQQLKTFQILALTTSLKSCLQFASDRPAYKSVTHDVRPTQVDIES